MGYRLAIWKEKIMDKLKQNINEYKNQIEKHQNQIIFLSGAIRALERLEKERENEETADDDDTGGGSTLFSVDVTPEGGPIDG